MFYRTFLCLVFGISAQAYSVAFTGAKVASYYGYDDCIQLRNETTSVTLCPAAGGRVLEYALDGKNIMYLPPGNEGWKYDPSKRRGPMDAGRFDIGPEKMVQRGPLLWMGKWAGEITGDRSATLTSQIDPKSGVQLVRKFTLAPASSHLVCKQTIRNVSDNPVSLCHWSRTFAVGNGIAVVPRSPLGRFPNGYVMYTNGNNINLRPEDDNIRVANDAVTVLAAPAQPKLGFDSHDGVIAYLSPTNHLFVKRFRTYPDRAYNEVAGLTISIWYPKNRDMIELEPIGPAENLKPGEEGSFTEEWWLMDHAYPADQQVDTAKLMITVNENTLPPK